MTKRWIWFSLNLYAIESITLLSCNSDAQANDNVNTEAKVRIINQFPTDSN